MTNPNLQAIDYFIGIDVSKNKLDFAVISEGNLLIKAVISNKPDPIHEFVGTLASKIPGYSLKKALFCMESTGIYCNCCLDVLYRFKAAVVLENALKIKRSMGLVRDKSDEKDAHRIALYAQRHKYQLRFWAPPRPPVARLRNLTELRDRLVTVCKILEMPVKEQQGFVLTDFHQETAQRCKRSALAVRADIKKVDQLIDKQIKVDKKLKELYGILTSVPGIGKYTALQLLISTNEFIHINEAKKLACYAGVAPFRIQSGLSATRARVSPHANKKLKSLLHICSVRVLRLEPELREFYLKKTETEKKSKMLVLNIIRNKLIKRICSCVREKRRYIRNVPDIR